MVTRSFYLKLITRVFKENNKRKGKMQNTVINRKHTLSAVVFYISEPL